MAVETTGGPALLLEERLLGAWSGVRVPADGRVVRSNMAAQDGRAGTDYDRAVETTLNGDASLLAVGDGQGVALCKASDAFPPVFDVIVHEPGRCTSIVLAGRDDELRFAAYQPDDVRVVTDRFLVNGALVLFDSSETPRSGDTLLQRFTSGHELVALGPGRYQIALQAWGTRHTPDYGLLAVLRRVGS